MKFLSRKFILTIVFTAIVVANGPLHLNMAWEQMVVLAGILGIYTAGNVYKTVTETGE